MVNTDVGKGGINLRIDDRDDFRRRVRTSLGNLGPDCRSTNE
jgi:hypothetical protein